MNIFYILSCIITIAHSKVWDETPKQFNIGNTYRFHYQSQALTGLPKTSAQFQGIFFDSIIELNFQQKNFVVMSMKKTKLYKTNKTILTENVYAFHSKDYFEEINLSENENKRFVELSLPVRFVWKINEKIEFFLAHSKDNPISLNIKRAVVNMINFKLTLLDRDWNRSGKSYVEPNDEGIEGNCEAKYWWVSFPYRTLGEPLNSARSIALRKFRSINNCKNRVDVSRANFELYKSHVNCHNENMTLIQHQTHSSMNLTIWKTKQYFIWEASSQSEYFIADSDEDHDTMSTFMSQRLDFIETINEIISGPENMYRTSLKMEINPLIITLTKNHLANLKELLLKSIENMTEISPELLEILKQANEHNLQQIYEELFTKFKRSSRQKKRFMDIISEVLTLDSTKFIINKFLEEKNHNAENDNILASRIGNLAGLNYVENTKIISFLMDTANLEMIKTNIFCRNSLQTIWLTIASLTNKYYKQYSLTAHKLDKRKMINYYSKQLKNLKTSLPDEIKNIVLIKSLGNLGIIEILPVLENILLNRSLPSALKAQAIYSLRKVPRDIKSKEIHNLLISVLANVNEDVEVRLAACLDIFLNSDSVSILQVVYNIYSVEPIRQVRSFIRSLVLNLNKISPKKSYEHFISTTASEDVDEFLSSFNVFELSSIQTLLFLSIIRPKSEFLPGYINVVAYQNRMGKLFEAFAIELRIENTGDLFQEVSKETCSILFLKFSNTSKKLIISSRLFGQEIKIQQFDSKMIDYLRCTLYGFNKLPRPMKFNFRFFQILYGKITIPSIMGIEYISQFYRLLEMDFQLELQQLDEKDKTRIHLKFNVQPSVSFKQTLTSRVRLNNYNCEIENKFIGELSNRLISSFSIKLSTKEEMKKIQFIFYSPKVPLHVGKMSRKIQFKTFYSTNEFDFKRNLILTKIDPIAFEGDLRKRKTIRRPFLFESVIEITYYCDLISSYGNYKLLKLDAGDFFMDINLKKGGDKQIVLLMLEILVQIKPDFDVTINIYNLVSKHVSRQVMLMVASIKDSFEKGKRETSFSLILHFYELLHNLPFDNIKKAENLKNAFVLYKGKVIWTQPKSFNLTNPLKYEKTTNENGGIIIYEFNNYQRPTNLYVIALGIDEMSKRKLEKIIKNPKKAARNNKFVRECVKDIEFGIPHSPACFNLWIYFNVYNEIEIIIIPLKYSQSQNHLKLDYGNSKNESKSSSVNFPKPKQLKIFSTKFSNKITIQTDFSKNLYNEVLLEKQSEKYLYRSFRSLISIFQRRTLTKMCQISWGQNGKGVVNTFDDYSYYISDINKFIHNKSVVKRTLVQNTKKTFQISLIVLDSVKIIQILTNKLCVIRLMKSKYGLQVFVNNVLVKLPHRIIRENKTEVEIEMLNFNIHGLKYMFLVDLPIHKVIIETDIINILNIEVSENYRSKLRGICGDFDGETFNEFKNLNCTGTFQSAANSFFSEDYSDIGSMFPYSKGYDFILNNKRYSEYLQIQKCIKGNNLYLIK